MKNDFGAHFFKDQSGTTAIEYGLIGALISVVCIAGMILVGTGL
jgi:pilus assembly protein Flp/PilA